MTAFGDRNYYKKNREMLIEKSKAFAKTEAGRAAHLRAKRKEAETLTDNYVKSIIYRKSKLKGVTINRKDITPEQLDAQRKLIITKRILNSLKNEKEQES